MNPVQSKLLEKDKKSLEVAKPIHDSGYDDFAISRAYYAMFYFASAFLEQENISYRKHSGVISAFGQYFTKTERVPQRYHRYLIEAEKLRKGADYKLDIDINHDEAYQVIQQAKAMLLFSFDNLLDST